MELQKRISDNEKSLLTGVILLACLLFTNFYSYLFFHALSELISIGVAWGVFMIAWNSRKLSDNNPVTFLGIAYLFIGSIDLLHTLAYKGMNIFQGYDTDLPTQLWIAGRYFQSISFVLLVFIPFRKINFNYVMLGFAFVFTLAFLSIFTWKIFPACFIEGSGLTAFKKTSEYVNCLILLSAIILLNKGRLGFDSNMFSLLITSMVLLIFSELAFTFYITAYDLSNMTGHILKLVSSFFIYKILIEISIKKPFSLLFKELKQNESHLKQLNMDLNVLNEKLQNELMEKKMAELKLKNAVNKLEASNHELEQFAYIASHDLQEPLRMVSSYTQLLERRYKDKLDPAAITYINFAVDGARRMHQLIKGLLEFSRVSTKKEDFSSVDMNTVIAAALKNLEVSIKESEAEIKTDQMPIVTGDEVQLIQLIQNLTGNAIKFREVGQKPVIEVGVECIQNENVFHVKDNGIGIAPEYSEKIFNIFQRLHSSDAYPGTGIGLAICKRIVERHGGKIWIESEEGTGTTFLFTLKNNKQNYS